MKRFGWLSDTHSTSPVDADVSLAASIRSKEVMVSDPLLESIIGRSLEQSATELLASSELTERQTFRLVSHFDALLKPFIIASNYSPEKLRTVIRQESDDATLIRMITACVDYLEDSCDPSADPVEVRKYVQFVSLVVDSKFVNWYVRSGPIAGPLTRLAAVVNRFRQSLFLDQQDRMKLGCSELDSMLQAKAPPRFDGNLFYYELK